MKKLLVVAVAVVAIASLGGCIGAMGSVSGEEVDVEGALGTPPANGFEGAVGSPGTQADWSKVPACCRRH